MKRFIAAQVLGMVLLGAPVAVFADSTQNDQILHALGVIAALTAQRDHTALACAVATTVTSVKVGEQFSLVWNSVGAVSPEENSGRSVFSPGGSTVLVLDTVGAFRYDMDFYSPSGEKVTCSAVISIRS